MYPTKKRIGLIAALLSLAVFMNMQSAAAATVSKEKYDADIAAKDAIIADMKQDAVITDLKSLIDKKDARIVELEKILAEKDAKIAELEKIVAGTAKSSAEDESASERQKATPSGKGFRPKSQW